MIKLPTNAISVEDREGNVWQTWSTPNADGTHTIHQLLVVPEGKPLPKQFVPK